MHPAAAPGPAARPAYSPSYHLGRCPSSVKLGKLSTEKFACVVEFDDWTCYIIYNSLRIRNGVNMVLPEDSSNPIVEVLKEISDSLDRNTEILNKIANHYDSVVPVMKRNADAIEESREDNRSPLDKMYESVFNN